jgi:ATP-binding cassette subfamily A (ABC1) protein 3
VAVLFERRLYDAREAKKSSWAFWRKRRLNTPTDETCPPDTAIYIRNLKKTFSTSLWGRKKGFVTAISDLTLRIPKFGIFVLLGSNG